MRGRHADDRMLSMEIFFHILWNGFSLRRRMCIMAHMFKHPKHILDTILIALIAGATIQTAALAQTTQTTEPIRLEPITVNVYKEKDDAQRVPVSVTGVTESTLRGAGILKI